MNDAQVTTKTRLPESVYAQRRATVAVVLAGAIAVLVFGLATTQTVPTDIITVTVSSGDSLWVLAERYAPENQDPRDWIYDVRILNNLPTSELMPGMQLQVPTLSTP